MRIVENKNKSVANRVRQQIKENNGYCLCTNEKNESTKCMCEQFTESTTLGFCHCRLYEKVEL